MFSLHICLHTMCEPGAPGVQNKASDPLAPLLRMVVNHHMGA